MILEIFFFIYLIYVLIVGIFLYFFEMRFIKKKDDYEKCEYFILLFGLSVLIMLLIVIWVIVNNVMDLWLLCMFIILEIFIVIMIFFGLLVVVVI